MTDQPSTVRLTRRQREIMAFIAEGWSSTEIGAWFFISEDTVKTHIRRMFQTMGARNRAHAVHLAHTLGVQLPDVSTIPEGGTPPVSTVIEEQGADRPPEVRPVPAVVAKAPAFTGEWIGGMVKRPVLA